MVRSLFSSAGGIPESLFVGNSGLSAWFEPSPARGDGLDSSSGALVVDGDGAAAEGGVAGVAASDGDGAGSAALSGTVGTTKSEMTTATTTLVRLVVENLV